MNLNPTVIAALKPLGYPIRHLTWRSIDGAKPDTYFVFFFYSDAEGDWASGKAIREDVVGQVSLFSKGNYKTLADNAVAALKSAGFYASQGQEFYEEETGYYHQIIDIAWYEDLYSR